MADESSLSLSKTDRFHQKVMREIAASMADTPYVLKGGTALLLTRGLERHSTDLDFDSSKKLNIGKRLQEVMEKHGAKVDRFSMTKDTDTVQRFKAHYTEPEGTAQFLKVETSFRDDPDPKTIEVVQGIKTYKVDTLFDQKLDAFENRTASRDLYDLAHLVKEYGSSLSNEQISRADNATCDIDNVEARFDDDFEADPVLKGISAAEVVLSLRENIAREQERRGCASEADRR